MFDTPHTKTVPFHWMPIARLEGTQVVIGMATVQFNGTGVVAPTYADFDDGGCGIALLQPSARLGIPAQARGFALKQVCAHMAKIEINSRKALRLARPAGRARAFLSRPGRFSI